MKIHNRLPEGEWKLVRTASRSMLEFVVNAYKEAGAEDVACMPNKYGDCFPPLEIEYDVYVKGGFSIRRLEQRLFN